jgi:hypothetical protein
MTNLLHSGESIILESWLISEARGGVVKLRSCECPAAHSYSYMIYTSLKTGEPVKCPVRLEHWGIFMIRLRLREIHPRQLHLHLQALGPTDHFAHASPSHCYPAPAAAHTFAG